jgi:broad specificity phosphatase PhoE
LHTLPEEYLKVMHSLHYKAPNGENWPEARERAMKYLASIAEEGHHLVSTHGGIDVRIDVSPWIEGSSTKLLND